jgi:hypothetical protein
MARSDISVSIGWWVGPSPPSPIESCVNTYVSEVPISAERRSAGRR